MSSLPAVPAPERSPLTRRAEGWLLPFLARVLRDTSVLTPLVLHPPPAPNSLRSLQRPGPHLLGPLLQLGLV